MLSRFCTVCDKPFGLEGPYAENLYKKKKYPVCCLKCLEEFKKQAAKYIANIKKRRGSVL